MIIADNIQLSLFPESGKELVRIAGFTATVNLVKYRGGRRVKFPKYPNKSHFLVPVIGFDALVLYCRAYCGEEISIPKCNSAMIHIKHQEIFADKKTGMNNVNLAEKYNYTEAGMRLLIQKMEKLT